MKNWLFAILTVSVILAQPLNATSFYLTTSGSDSNSGTSSSSAFGSLAYAVTQLSAGDILYVSSGSYDESDSPIVIQTDGTSSSPITIYGNSSSRPVFTFDGDESSSNRGVVMDADYWIWKNVVIENAGDNGMLLSGNDNTIQNCIFRGNHDTGLQLSRYSSSADAIDEWPTDNYIYKCIAYDNCDDDAEDADGFAAKLTCGEGNVFEKCVSHHNVDDGWDLYTKSSTGEIGVVTFIDCIAHSNGTLTDGSTTGSGDKNGFKLGSSSNTVDHILVRCAAFYNGHHGFTDNGNIGSIKFINCTSYDNDEYNYHTRDNASHTFINCISYDGEDRIVGTASSSCNALIDDDYDFDYTASSSDFESLSAGDDDDPCSDGFLNLSSSSDFIDAGTTSSYLDSYSGSAPDLGAFEYGSSSSDDDDDDDDDAEESITMTASAGDSYVSLSWSITGIDIRNLQLYRDTDSDPDGRTRIATPDADATSYTDSDVSNGTTYYYWLKIVDTDLETHNSDAVGATPVSDDETAITLTTSAGDGYVTLNWSTTNIDIRNIQVYRDTDSDTDGRTRIGAADADETTYTDSDVTNGTTYYYWIKIVDTDLVTYNSDAVSGTPTSSSNNSSSSSSDEEDIIEDDDSRLISYDGSLKSYSNANNGYAINLSNDAGKQIVWNYDADSEGTYTITLHYTRKSSMSEYAYIYLNSSLTKTLTLDETSSSEFTTSSFTLTLESGTNEIIFETVEDGEAADVDYISVTAADTKSTNALSDINSNNTTIFLSQNYPNPVDDYTSIDFALSSESDIILFVTNLSGQQVAVLANCHMSEGAHSVIFNADNYSLPAGTYIYTLITNKGIASKCMVIK